MLYEATPEQIIACYLEDEKRRAMCAEILARYGEELKDKKNANKGAWLDYPNNAPEPTTLYELKVSHANKNIDAKGTWNPETKTWKLQNHAKGRVMKFKKYF